MPAQRKISTKQMSILIDFMTANKDLAKGRWKNGLLGKQVCEQRWNHLTNLLNSQSDGSTKSTQQWKIYWNNIKYKARAKASQRCSYMAGTGGGPAWAKGDLNEDEWKIMNIQEKESIQGEESVKIPFEGEPSIPGNTLPESIQPPAITHQTAIGIEASTTEGTSLATQAEPPRAQVSSTPTPPPCVSRSPSVVIENTVSQRDENTDTRNTIKKRKKKVQNNIVEMHQEIVNSNTAFKRRHLEMMEVEHRYNVEISKLTIKKLELEIALLEDKKNTRTEE